ncbi:MAG: TadE/TadG family type IV pilus assembly protein [Methylocella sp.]
MSRHRGMLMVLAKRLAAFFSRERLAIAGVAAVELALVSPLLVTGVLGAGELGISILRETQVQYAAQAGIIYARAKGFDSTKMSTAITNATAYASITATPAPSQFCGCASATGVTVVKTCTSTCTCTTTCSSGFTAGTYATSSAQALFTPIIPNPWQQSTVTLSYQATERIR